MSQWLQNRIDRVPAGGVVEIPAGELDAGIIEINKAMTIVAPWEGRGQTDQLLNCEGIVIGAAGVKLQGLSIDCAAGSGDGIFADFRFTGEDLRINHTVGRGIAIEADVTGNPPTNANEWQLMNVVINNTGGDGLYINGGDVNVGYARKVSAVHCGGWGINDSGFLGDTFVSCHVSDCDLGAYKTDNPNARHVFLSCYSEGNSPPANLVSPTIVIGGLHGAGIEGTALVIRDGEISGHSVFKEDNPELRLNRYSNSALDVVADGDHSHGWSLGWFDPVSGTVQFRHARLSSRVPVMLTTDLTTLVDQNSDPLPGGELVLPKNAFWVPDGTGKYKKISF